MLERLKQNINSKRVSKHYFWKIIFFVKDKFKFSSLINVLKTITILFKKISLKERSKESGKYMLCRPEGGLNDVLCQIEKCWEYAETKNRVLIVDSDLKTNLSGVRDHFSNYFEPKHLDPNVFLNLDQDMFYRLSMMTTFPKVVEGRLHSYELEKDEEGAKLEEKKSKIKTTIDFTKEYEEKLLVHHQFGGGEKSLNCLKRLRFKKDARDIILKRINYLPKGYIGIHVRNTDYKTDYKVFFESIKEEMYGKNILMCSDDYSCIEYAKIFFEKSNIFTISNIPDLKGKPIHLANKKTKQDVFEYNINTFCDLVALAMSDKIYFQNIDLSKVKVLCLLKMSGFTKLALNLHNDKSVVESLLS